MLGLQLRGQARGYKKQVQTTNPASQNIHLQAITFNCMHGRGQTDINFVSLVRSF
jgi:hypothetical protein